MSWIQCLKWLNRERITLIVGSLALAMGALIPWYRLPSEALETFGTNLSLVNVGRTLVALFSLLGFIFTFFSSPGRFLRLPFWIGLIAVLLFPYFITTWSPNVAFISASYYDQGRRVTQHIDKNFPQVQADWKQYISLPTSRHIQSTFDFSIKDSRFFQPSSWDQILVEGLGYSNSFFGFIGRGWLLSVTGLGIALVALYLELVDESLNVFLKDMGRVLPWVGLLLGVLVFSFILPNIINHQLDTMLAKGEYHQIVTTSQTLAAWYPPLKGDEVFLKRIAEAGFYGNEPDPALIYFAKGLERYRLGDFVKAENYFQQSLDIEPSRFLVRGYLANAILNQGVNYFNDSTNPNNHKSETAIDRFEQVVRIFPDHIEALYNLMLASVVNGEFEKSALVAHQLKDTQQYFQQPSLSIIGQAYVHLTWASYRDGDTTQAWKQYRQSIDDSSWDQSDEE